MKFKSIISLFIFCMGLGLFTTSCEDMLSSDSERNVYPDGIAQDSLYSYWGIVKSLQNIAERYVILNECRGELLSEIEDNDNTSREIKAILNFGNNYDDIYKDGASDYLQVKDYYHVINSCNAYIANCDTAEMTAKDTHKMYKEFAQVLAIRAWVYMQLVNAYGTVPFVDKPMLTTADIDEYMKSPELVNSETLAGRLAPDLAKMYASVEADQRYGFPSYENYGDVSSGDNNYVCHSNKVMFPLSIVLGDLYLMANDYTNAATYYYNFLNDKYARYGGPDDPIRYVAKATVSNYQDEASYLIPQGIVWNERGAYDRKNEAITCIPSNQGKLNGKVLTEVNRLFGWTPEQRAGNVNQKDDSGEITDSKTTAYVTLTQNYDRELGASHAYEALCDSQRYEIYLANMDNATFLNFSSSEELKTPNGKGVGDARRAWIYNQSGSRKGLVYQKNTAEGESLFGKFITKQNPLGGFTTCFPMVYRKSMVWLRFAEALNRMGYPSVAFAILRDGICYNEDWFPTESDFDPAEMQLTINYMDAEGNAHSFPSPVTVNTTDTLLNISDVNTAMTAATRPEWYEARFGAAEQALIDAVSELSYEDSVTVTSGQPTWNVTKYKNYISGVNRSDHVCYYVDKDEVSDFTAQFTLTGIDMRGFSSERTVSYKADMSKDQVRNVGSNTQSKDPITIGIHQHGCGIIALCDTLSSYNYVDMVAKKAIEEGYTTTELTKEEIYGKENLDIVQKAVEDLIIDEMALELAFEGTRFADLSRVAIRRNDNSYLAKRIKNRTSQENKALEDWLMNRDHWYLPLPQKTK